MAVWTTAESCTPLPCGRRGDFQRRRGSGGRTQGGRDGERDRKEARALLCELVLHVQSSMVSE